MSEPLASFEQFVKERIYLKAVSKKTETWYWTAWKAFQTAVGDPTPAPVTKARLQAFVVALRDRGVKPRSVNTSCNASTPTAAGCTWNTGMT